MAAIGFYHLTRSGPEQALPPLLGRTLAAGQRAMVLCDSDERLAALDTALWLAPTPDWLPHGSAADGDATLQPIWLTTADAQPASGDAANGARYLFVIDGAGAPDLAAFERVFDLFDGGSEAAVAAAANAGRRPGPRATRSPTGSRRQPAGKTRLTARRDPRDAASIPLNILNILILLVNFRLSHDNLLAESEMIPQKKAPMNTIEADDMSNRTFAAPAPAAPLRAGRRSRRRCSWAA